MRRFVTLVLAVLLMLAAGCGGSEIKLGAADSGSSLKLSPGQVMAVTLEGNPSTGYGWYVVGELPDILEQQGEPEFVADAGSANKVGAGGMLTSKFKALKAGTAVLTLGYMRSWEDKAPIQTYTLTVEVTAK
ncbi:MAG: protease inhibitor I42 family protein [Chloroflexi bacterium]|nr:protease inhibitor I42 family protein [Chloroflexota bacterium]